MTWDIDLIIEKMKFIANKLSVETEELNRFLLIDEYQILSELVNFDGRKTIREVNNHFLENLQKYEVKESNNYIRNYIDMYKNKEIDMIKKKKRELLHLQKELKKIPIVSSDHIKIPKMNNEEYLRILQPFLNNCYFEIDEIFREMKDGNIFFTNKKSDALGKAISPLGSIESYIYVYKPLDNPVSLPHELIHAYEYNNVDNKIHKIAINKSSFCETLAIFTEFLFSNFYLNTDYPEMAIYNYYDNLTDIEFLNRRLKKYLKLNIENVQLYLSKLLASHLYYLYINEPMKFDIFMNKYIKLFFHNAIQIWDIIDFEELLDSYNEVTKEYNRILIKG